MDIRISSAPVDQLKHEALAVFFYSDERPPKGFCGTVDWRMNGLISRYMASGMILGNYLERILFTPYRIGCGKLFLFGMGKREALTRERVLALGQDMGKTLSAAGVYRIACHITGKSPFPLPASEMTTSAFTGMIESYDRSGRQLPVDITCIVHPDDLRDEILLGLYQLKVGAKVDSDIRIHQ